MDNQKPLRKNFKIYIQSTHTVKFLTNFQKGCMVVGIDVCYQKGQPSVTGFVSSLNPTLTRWFSIVNIQKQNQQMSDSLQINIYRALEHYYAVKLPNF